MTYKNCSYLMYASYWVWAYAHILGIITLKDTKQIYHLQKFPMLVCILFVVVRIINIRPLLLTYFRINNTVLLTTGTLLYSELISRIYSCHITEILYPLSNNSLISPFLILWQATTILFSASMSMTGLGIKHK